MRYLFPVFFLCINFCYAQETANVETPKIIAKVKLGETIEIEGKTMTFKRVVTDSRCPIGVDCVWPGEAKLVLLIEDGTTTQEKEIILGAKETAANGALIFETEDKEVFAHNLKPYPEAGKTIEAGEYYLEVFRIRKKSE